MSAHQKEPGLEELEDMRASEVFQAMMDQQNIDRQAESDRHQAIFAELQAQRQQSTIVAVVAVVVVVVVAATNLGLIYLFLC